MKLIEMLKMCADEQQVLVIVKRDFLAPMVKGEAEVLGKYLCCGILNSKVCGVGTDDGDVLKVWVEEAKNHENTCAD